MTSQIGGSFKNIFVYRDTGSIESGSYHNFLHKRNANLSHNYTFYFSKYKFKASSYSQKTAQVELDAV